MLDHRCQSLSTGNDHLWRYLLASFRQRACSLPSVTLSYLPNALIISFHFIVYVDDVLAKAGFEPELFEKDVENHPPADWREIGLDDVPTYTLSFSTERKDLGELEKGDYK
jgi:hypothetical protein